MDLSVRQFIQTVLGAGIALAAGQRRRLAPGDESASDPAFAKLLTELRAVAAAKDATKLRAMCAPNVMTGFDGTSGPSELIKKMNDGGWSKLQTVLQLGVAKYEGGFALPYLFAKFPEDLESTEHLVTIRQGAVLRAAGKADSPVVCPLDYDILRVDDAEPVNGWIRAARLDGPKGWVAAGDVRSVTAERILFEKRSGTWKITAWAAGD